ncbi:MAG: 50S ribosomal protein L30 [Lachnospiraceae bacterium]|nr:50S ribosomal protein L30 [Lachnospiraceae bacterium]
MAAKKAETKTLKITLVKSTIGQIPKAKATIEAMGLRKIGQTVELPDNDATKGQIQKVRHMVKVEEA